MAKVDIKLGTSLVAVYDGAPEHLTTFLDSVNLFNDTVEADFANATAAQKQAAQQTVLRFIKTRLTGKARQAATDNQTLAEMLTAVKEHCVSKVTPDNLIAQLRTLKRGENLPEFCQQLDKIISQLKAAYLRDDIPQETAQKMATKSGIETLIRCAKNNEVKTILKAGTFHSLNEAVQKFQENETINTPSTVSQIYFGNSSRGNQNRGRGNFRGNRGRGTFNTRRYDSQNFQRENFNQSRFQRGNWNPRGNWIPRSNWNQRGHVRPNMFMAQQNFQEQQLQQQMQHLQLQQQQNLQQQLQQQQPQYPQSNIHPLGVPFGQHTQ